jgi:hypothetical protein
MFRRLTASMVLTCTLVSCTAARMQTPVLEPVMSAELQQAFERGPLCPRLDGTNWPCSDTDGRLWKEWYTQRQEAGVLGVGPDYATPTVLQVAAGVAGVALVGAAIVLAAGASASSSHYHYYAPSRITTRCAYGLYRSTCTTTSW